MTTLPIPSDIALAHSEKLAAHLREAIRAAGGAISFARFMELALYAPGLGYYSAGSHKLGPQGDFITAPEISPLFAASVAAAAAPLLQALGDGNWLEIGAGSGRFAVDVLSALAKRDALPAHYYILEISADLRAKQQALLTTSCPELATRVHWLDTLPTDFDGIIFANEVLDALPVHLFQIENQTVMERCVTWQNEQFTWQLTAPTTPDMATSLAPLSLANGYQSEINLFIAPWLKSLSNSLRKGAVLLFDYGYGRAEYYHPERHMGTLMCYYQHRRHDNPFIYLGLQDITAHVNFTTVAESALDVGFTLAGYTTQAGFLLATGITTLADNTTDPVQHYQQAQAIKRLTLPAEMGEAVKVMALTKGIDLPLQGFHLHDRRRDL